MAQMRGFFSDRVHAPAPKDKIRLPTEKSGRTGVRVGGNGSGRKSTKATYDCERCGLYDGCISPKMQWSGEGRKKILVIAEAPGKTEDEQGIQLVGEAGDLLADSMHKAGIDLHEDCWKINAVNCRPPRNRTPNKTEIRCCKNEIVQGVLDELQPEHIWLMGNAALDSFYLDRLGDASPTVTKWRGRCIPDRSSNAWVSPMFHPSFLVRNAKDANLRMIFEKDLKNAAKRLRRSPPQFDNEADHVVLVKQFDDLIERLTWLRDEFEGLMVHDYETSGLRPQESGHCIWSISYCVDPNEAVSFPLDYPHWSRNERDQIELLWKEILAKPTIKKIAHNLKFEDIWSREILKQLTVSWEWDTMLGSHILDNRTHMHSLKLQLYLNFGLEGYEEGFKKFMTTKGPDGIRNRLNEVPLDDLLLYGGIDSLGTFRLYEVQASAMGCVTSQSSTRLADAYRFYHRGLVALSDVESEGISTDQSYYETTRTDIQAQIQQLTDDIMKTEEAQIFADRAGRDIVLTSSADLRTLFFDYMALTPPKTTDNGNASVDREVIEQLDLPMSKMITEKRKLEKVAGTYLRQFIDLSIDGKIYPNFNLHTVTTYRSSSNNPNFQNIPVRDEMAKKYTRSGIIPPTGYKLLEVDYGAIEVRVIACYTEDDALLKYIHDPSTDMHRDQAMDIFMIVPEEWKQLIKKVSHPLRHNGKNNFVFPEFYGSWYGDCARGIWDECADMPSVDDIPVKRWVEDHFEDWESHLSEAEMRNFKRKSAYERWEYHMKCVENRFWDKFSGVRQWQNDSVQRYIEKGYIETKLGFRYQGYMKRNDIYNYPIQGTAFHMLLWSLTQLNRELRAKDMRTRAVGQIHDSIVFNLWPEEQEEVLAMCQRIMCEEIREEHPWIITPLIIEPEITEINQAWYFKKEIKAA